MTASASASGAGDASGVDRSDRAGADQDEHGEEGERRVARPRPSAEAPDPLLSGEGRRDRQQGQGEHQPRRQVANVEPEADRHALGPRGAERGEQIGDRRQQRDHGEHPLHAAAAPEHEQHGDHGERQVGGPELAEALVERRGEVAPPDAGVGRVVGDRVRMAALQGLGVVDRPDVLPGERVAGDDQVARRTSSRHRRPSPRSTRPSRAQAVAGAADPDDADGQREDRRDDRQLGPEGQSRRQSRDEQGPRGRARRSGWVGGARRSGQRVLRSTRHGREEERDRHDVVVGVARLAREEEVGGHHRGHRGEADRARPVGPADAVARRTGRGRARPC